MDVGPHLRPTDRAVEGDAMSGTPPRLAERRSRGAGGSRFTRACLLTIWQLCRHGCVRHSGRTVAASVTQLSWGTPRGRGQPPYRSALERPRTRSLPDACSTSTRLPAPVPVLWGEEGPKHPSLAVVHQYRRGRQNDLGAGYSCRLAVPLRGLPFRLGGYDLAHPSAIADVIPPVPYVTAVIGCQQWRVRVSATVTPNQSPRTPQPLLRDFRRRLNELISAAYPDEAARPGYARMAREIRECTGGSISATYLWELATGKKSNVTLEQLGVLSDFFGVPPGYFLNDEVAERVRRQIALAQALRDSKVRSLALRADGLSEESLDALLVMVNQVRRLQNLPDPVEAPEDDQGVK